MSQTVSEAVKPDNSVNGNNDSNKTSFDQMHLKVGQKMQLSLVSSLKPTNDSYSNSYTSSLIGYIHDTVLIVSMPASDALLGEPFIEGDQLQARLFSGQSAYTFSVFVEKIIKLPFKYLHLSFPKKISAQNIRNSRRVRCCYQGTEVQKNIAMQIIDISTSGAGIESQLPVGSLVTEVKLSFVAPVFDEDLPFSINGVVRSAEPINKNGKKFIVTGVEFIDLEKKQLTSLRHLIYQVIVEHPDFIM